MSDQRLESATINSSQPWTAVQWALRGLGVLDICALFAFAMPREWIAIGHSFTGLGELPPGALVAYLVRSASFLYALHGALMIYLSFDVPRYWSFIRFFASLKVLHGVAMFSIDVREGMPLWWMIFEGPAFAFTGIIVLAAQAFESRAKCKSATDTGLA